MNLHYLGVQITGFISHSCFFLSKTMEFVIDITIPLSDISPLIYDDMFTSIQSYILFV